MIVTHLTVLAGGKGHVAFDSVGGSHSFRIEETLNAAS